MKEEKDLSSIAGLLNYGTFMSESKKILLIEYIAILFICFSMLILAVVMTSIEYVKSSISLTDLIITVILFTFNFSIMPVIVTIMVVINEKMRKKVNLWMEDAVLVTAFARNIGVKRTLGVAPGTKLQVEFEIDGVRYTRESHSRHYKNKDFDGGYYFIWNKFADKQIRILYSPQYDEVMVLKD